MPGCCQTTCAWALDLPLTNVTGKPQKVRSHVYDLCIPKYRPAFGTSVPTMKLKRDYKESRSLAGRPDVLTGPGSDGPSWMTAGTGKALLDAIFAALHAVRQRCFGRLQVLPTFGASGPA